MTGWAWLVACTPKPAPPVVLPVVELVERRPVVETVGGVQVEDPYRWLEDGADPVVAAWVEGRRRDYVAATDPLDQRRWLYDRFQAWWRYDDVSVRTPCRLGAGETWVTKAASQDKSVHWFAEQPGDVGRVVLDPNTWSPTETLAGFTTSPDCRYVVFGKANAGDENPVLQVMDLRTLEVMPDTFRGWKQGDVAWKHDNSGFFYTSKPLASERPGADAFYFHRVWWHAFGTSADADVLIASDESVREYWHGVSVSEDGLWLLHTQSLFNTSRVWLSPAAGGERVPVDTSMTARVNAIVVGEQLVVLTDWEAPNQRVMVAPLTSPERANWRELVAESEDRLVDVSPIDGRLYLTYLHDVATRIVVVALDGSALGDVALPTVGTASVSGRFSQPWIRLTFESFAHPTDVYRVDAAGALTLEDASSVPVDRALLDRILVEQIWFTSRDGTRVPMFVVRERDNFGPAPVLLTGYGGFNVSRRPGFSTAALAWIAAGGVYALPTLRGGGEYGKTWHEAGMREHKQNVFDDFIGAATWLVEEGFTRTEQLAITGRSNGGLLTSAAITQRPDLFGAALVGVPLADMMRFHTFGLANIWTEEYGSPDDPAMAPHLLAYSPYHRVAAGTDYPAVLVLGSTNDARTDPAHARKFFAATQWADVDHGAVQPILLDIAPESGHGGGVTIDVRADQESRSLGFLMNAVGLVAPPSPAASGPE